MQIFGDTAAPVKLLGERIAGVITFYREGFELRE